MHDYLLNIYAVIVMFLLFGLTIFVHEFGHFIVAIKLGLVVETFSIGFGPAIWKKKYKGVLYKIGCIPFGGYVAIPQLDPTAMEGIQGKSGKSGKSGQTDDGQKAADEEKERREYPEVPFWKRILVSAAGASCNVLLAILFAWIIYLHPGAITAEKTPLTLQIEEGTPAFEGGLRTGQDILAVEGEVVTTWTDFMIECHLNSGATNMVNVTVKSGDSVLTAGVLTEKNEDGIYRIIGLKPLHPAVCKIGHVIKGGAAEEAGVKLGDIVTEFNGTEVNEWDQFLDMVSNSSEGEFSLKVLRRGKEVPLTVVPKMNEEYGRMMIGVVYAGDAVPAWMYYKKPMDQIESDAKGIWRILRALVSKKKGVAKQAAGALGGPVMILSILLTSIKLSLLNAVGFLRFLNINLAILNMLPIPVLDGGHIVFALWEGLTRKKPHPRVINILVNIFMVLLLGAMLILSVRDVNRVFPGLDKLFGSDDSVEETVQEGVLPESE